MYVDNKECQVAVLNISRGSTIPPRLDNVYLVNENDRLIDASSFADHAAVKVSGAAGFMEAIDGNGQIAMPISLAQRQKIDRTGVWDTEAPVLKINTISLLSGEKVTLRFAVARPSTQPSPTTMP